MKNILCFGDSNTWGLIPDNTGDFKRYPWGQRWTSIVQDELENEGVHIIEDGLCGRTTVFEDAFRKYRNGSAVLPLSLEVNAGIDTIIIMLGTNDCKTGYGANPGVIGKGIEVLINQVRAYNDNIKILLISPIHLGEDVWQQGFDPEFDQESVKKSIELKGVYEKISRKFDVEFLAASDYAHPSKNDMEHMSVEGHKSLAKAVVSKLRQINEAA